MDQRSDDLSQEEDLPQPGTEEPRTSEKGSSPEGPGNVSVDEPTEPALEADSLDELPNPPGGSPQPSEDDGSEDDVSDPGEDSSDDSDDSSDSSDSSEDSGDDDGGGEGTDDGSG